MSDSAIHDAPERWLPVVGFDGLYDVSDRGRIRSLDHLVPCDSRGNFRRATGRIIHQTIDGRYLKVTLSRGDGTRMHRRVHRLVLEAFVGPCPPGMETLHGPGGGRDNRIENLRWGTRSENCRDIVAHGKHHLARRTHCKRGNHAFTPENTYVHPVKGGRVCRTCRADHRSRYEERQRKAA